MPNKTRQSYKFEGYRLDSQPAGLWRDGKLISLPPKVLDMLILLVERKGEIVTREELLDAVWPDTHVEEGNIKYTISLLRKALGKELVQTIPRRGYRFVATVSDTPANGRELYQSAAAGMGALETTANPGPALTAPSGIAKTRSPRALKQAKHSQ